MNFSGGKFYKPTLIVLTILCLIGVSRIQPVLNDQRDKMGITRLKPLDNAPPVLAFTTVALGGFRGLIANALWIRMNELQDEDKYFEMMQLADWITKLEPHLAQVWTVQAWNMAYNISVKFPDPNDRWRWVKAGVELLRDEALKYNPDEPIIYRELGWFFQHKIGMNLDDAHNLYKGAWIGEMRRALGGNGVPDFGKLLSPGTLEESNRVQQLKEVYKLDPVVMKKVDDHYGPLDWRLPEAHAIYWASLGLEKSRDTNLIILRRMIYQSMQMAFYRGALVVRTNGGNLTYSTGPNLAIVPNANKSYEEMIKIDEEYRDNIMNAHKHFLANLPFYFYTYGRRSDAETWMKYARKKYPDAFPAGLSLEEYVIKEVNDIAGGTDRDRVTMVISGLIDHSLEALVNDEDERALNYQHLAEAVWNTYMGQITNTVSAKRVPLDALAAMNRNELERFLDPVDGLGPQSAAILRTKLHLPGPSNAPSSSTNAVPAPQRPAPAATGGASATNAPAQSEPAPK
jgi:hypothetical protein